MRTRCLQRPNRGEGPCAYSALEQPYENKGSLEPTRKLKSTLARFTALGMTIQWCLIFLALSAGQPCAAMIKPLQETQPPTAQSTPTPAATASPIQSSPTPTPQPSPSPAVPQTTT